MHKKNIFLALSAVAIIGVGSLAFSKYKKITASPKTVYLSNSYIQLSPTEFIRQSTGIVLGSIEKVQVIKAKSTIRTGEDDILTKATVRIEKILSNSKNLISSAPMIDVEVIGGTLGSETMIAEDFPTLKEGERVVLFLGPEDKNTNAFTIFAGANGKYSVQAGNKLGNDAEAQFVRNVFGKEMTLNELEDKIVSTTSSN